MEEVEFDPQEMEVLIRTKKSRRKKRKYTRKNQISAEKDLSYITCFKCRTLGHYANMCPGKEPRNQGVGTITNKPRDLSKVICLRCKEVGHGARQCPERKEA